MKKFLMLGFAFLMSAGAQAAYLYWQTGSDSTFHGNTITGYTITAVDGSGNKTSFGTILDLEGDPYTMPTVGYKGGFDYIVDIGDHADGSSFYIEVIGYDSAAYGSKPGVIGVGEMVSYSDLVSQGSIEGPGIALDIPQMWTGGSVTIPEPTSGLMLLFGLACVGLKRRKV